MLRVVSCGESGEGGVGKKEQKRKKDGSVMGNTGC